MTGDKRYFVKSMFVLAAALAVLVSGCTVACDMNYYQSGCSDASCSDCGNFARRTRYGSYGSYRSTGSVGLLFPILWISAYEKAITWSFLPPPDCLRRSPAEPPASQ